LRPARVYLLGSGLALAALAILGFALVEAGAPRALGRAAAFDPSQSLLHAGLAAVSVAAGLAPRVHPMRWVVGLATFHLALGTLGLLAPGLFGYPARAGLALRWETGECFAHLLLGGWGAYVASNAATEKKERD